MLNVDCTHSGSDRKTKPDGFARIPHHVVADSRLVGCDLAVLARLLYYARDKGFCWPSVPTLAKALAKSDRTIQNAIGRLKRLGYLTTQSAENRTGRVISIHLDGQVGTPLQSTTSPTLHCKAGRVYAPHQNLSVPPSGGQESTTPQSVSPPPHQSTSPSGETAYSPSMTSVSPERNVISQETRTETRTSRPANPSFQPHGTLRPAHANRSPQPLTPLTALTPLDRLLLRFAEHGCSPEWVAKVLAEDFADQSSYPFFLKIASRSSWVIPEAYTAARKPDAVCPVKVFAAVASKLADRRLPKVTDRPSGRMSSNTHRSC